MKILIACEFSGIVTDAFIKRGHEAISCDLRLSESPENSHALGDVSFILNAGWDMMIAFPPCTHLAISGARYFYKKEKAQAEALDFIRLLLNAPINRIALENPVGVISTKIKKPNQIIQPWQFGHPFQKATCLWLKNLPPLIPTKIMDTKVSIHKESSSSKRWKNRIMTYSGIAEAMAEQWGVDDETNLNNIRRAYE